MRLQLTTAAFFLILIPLFLYNLGQYGLADFDEAWYAEIGRNVLIDKEPLLLTFNGMPFTDHPPLGFNLIAFSFFLFGINDFSARLPQAMAGWGSVILVYFIGKELANRFVGLASSLMLSSSVWFVFRSRSGNMDALFLFLFLGSFLGALKVRKNNSWIYVLAFFFASLLLTKSFIGISLIPSVILFFVIGKVKIPVKKLLGAVLLFLLLLLPWMARNYLALGIGYFVHLWEVSLRPGFRILPDFANLLSQNTFQYLHYGIGKWYYPALISFFAVIPFLKKHKILVPIYVLVVILLFGFLTNKKTEIWHILPIYPFFFLILSFFIYHYAYLILKKIGRRITLLAPGLLIIPVFIISFYQIYQFRNNIKLSDHGLNDLALASQNAKGSPEELFLDGHDFYPSTVFYSQKKVQHLRTLPAPYNSLAGFMEAIDKPVLLLTEDWRLKLDNVDPNRYEVLKKSGTWMLIKVRPSPFLI